MSARDERELLSISRSHIQAGRKLGVSTIDLQYRRLVSSFENQDVIARAKAAAAAAQEWRSLDLEDQDVFVRLVSGIWRHHVMADQHSRAERFARLLLSRGKRLGRPAIEAEGSLALGVLDLYRGRLKQSLEKLDLSRAIFASIGNLCDVVRASIPCADAHRFQGETESALGLLRRARSICLELEEIDLLGSVLFTQGLLRRDAGDLLDAEDCFRFVRESSELLSSRKRFLHGTLSLCSVLSRQGRFSEALPLAEEATSLAKRLKIRRDIAIAGEYRGDALLGIGELNGALSSYAKASKYVSVFLNDRPMQVEMHRKLAEYWCLRGHRRYLGIHVRKGRAKGGGSSEDMAALGRLEVELKRLDGNAGEALRDMIGHAQSVRSAGLGYEYVLACKRVFEIAGELGMKGVAEEWLARARVAAESAGTSLADAVSNTPQAAVCDPVTGLSNRDVCEDSADIDLARFGIITVSSHLRQRGAWLAKISKASVPVLFRGESGTGKELFARLVHELSPRRDKTFLALNCGALPSELLESELFGHRRGSFSGAVSDKIGVFRAAHEGTLFLDEIGEMPPGAQVRLLRVLESGEFRRVGDTKTEVVDVRIVAATNKDLRLAIRTGKFRRDLYFRLRGLEILLPPLRERLSDIPVLAEHFLEKCNQDLGKSLSLPFSTVEWLMGLQWPGNVRELRCFIEQAALLAPSSGELQPRYFVNAEVDSEKKTLPGQLEEIERARIRGALEASGGVITAAAKLLGITRTTLASRMKRLGISKGN